MIEHSYMVLLLLILFFLFRLYEYLDYFLFQEDVLDYRWLKEEFIENDFIGISKVNLLLNHLYFFVQLLNILISWYYFSDFFSRLHLYLEFDLYIKDIFCLKNKVSFLLYFLLRQVSLFSKEKRILSIE